MHNENVDSKVYEDLKEKIEIEEYKNIQVEKIKWLWKNIVAYEKITLFAGDPGMGKSQILLYIASILSNGKTFHLESTKCEEGKILLITNEDDPSDTIKPRLLVLGANINNIHNVTGIAKYDKRGNKYYDTISLVEHIHLLEDKIIAEKYSLIIVDPITMYLGSTDQNQNKEIRSALGILSALAKRHSLAIIVNSHFTKSGNTKRSAIERIMGSVGFAGAARIIFGMMRDPDDEGRRLFMPIKNNIGPDTHGYAYKIKPYLYGNGIGEIETCRIEWQEGRIEKKADDILNTPVTKVDPPKLKAAKDFLLTELKSCSQLVSDLRKKAEDLGISTGMLYEAKKQLNLYEDDNLGRKRWYISPTTPGND